MNDLRVAMFNVQRDTRRVPLNDDNREPLRQSKADLSRAKDTFERIHEIVVV